jgi:NAD(P)-dependent dehydrogenase (short-subunit alcohol dehydrogenase family)
VCRPRRFANWSDGEHTFFEADVDVGNLEAAITLVLGRTMEATMATVLVTGSNRGIGLALVSQLLSRGDRVIAACRTPSAALLNTSAEILDGVDVTDDASVASLSERLSGRHLDVLINNAGLLQRSTLDALDFDSMRRQFEINALGPLRVTAALLPNLSSGSTVAIVTSRMGSIEDNSSGGSYGYRMSKAAVNMAGRSLSHDLRRLGISVVLLHPGYVRTDMTANSGLIDTDTSAAGLIARIDEQTLAETGRFVHMSGEALPW